jgi:hypothetical protein
MVPRLFDIRRNPPLPGKPEILHTLFRRGAVKRKKKP